MSRRQIGGHHREEGSIKGSIVERGYREEETTERRGREHPLGSSWCAACPDLGGVHGLVPDVHPPEVLEEGQEGQVQPLLAALLVPLVHQTTKGGTHAPRGNTGSSRSDAR